MSFDIFPKDILLLIFDQINGKECVSVGLTSSINKLSIISNFQRSNINFTIRQLILSYKFPFHHIAYESLNTTDIIPNDKTKAKMFGHSYQTINMSYRYSYDIYDEFKLVGCEMVSKSKIITRRPSYTTIFNQHNTYEYIRASLNAKNFSNNNFMITMNIIYEWYSKIITTRREQKIKTINKDETIPFRHPLAQYFHDTKETIPMLEPSLKFTLSDKLKKNIILKYNSIDILNKGGMRFIPIFSMKLIKNTKFVPNTERKQLNKYYMLRFEMIDIEIIESNNLRRIYDVVLYDKFHQENVKLLKIGKFSRKDEFRQGVWRNISTIAYAHRSSPDHYFGKIVYNHGTTDKPLFKELELKGCEMTALVNTKRCMEPWITVCVSQLDKSFIETINSIYNNSNQYLLDIVSYLNDPVNKNKPDNELIHNKQAGCIILRRLLCVYSCHDPKYELRLNVKRGFLYPFRDAKQYTDKFINTENHDLSDKYIDFDVTKETTFVYQNGNRIDFESLRGRTIKFIPVLHFEGLEVFDLFIIKYYLKSAIITEF